jgi:hypothetical protein
MFVGIFLGNNVYWYYRLWLWFILDEPTQGKKNFRSQTLKVFPIEIKKTPIYQTKIHLRCSAPHPAHNVPGPPGAAVDIGWPSGLAPHCALQVNQVDSTAEHHDISWLSNQICALLLWLGGTDTLRPLAQDVCRVITLHVFRWQRATGQYSGAS